MSYQRLFINDISLEDLRNSLDKDSEVKFIVHSLQSLKSSCIKFHGDEDFLLYLYNIMIEKKKNPNLIFDK